MYVHDRKIEEHEVSNPSADALRFLEPTTRQAVENNTAREAKQIVSGINGAMDADNFNAAAQLIDYLHRGEIAAPRALRLALKRLTSLKQEKILSISIAEQTNLLSMGINRSNWNRFERTHAENLASRRELLTNTALVINKGISVFSEVLRYVGTLAINTVRGVVSTPVTEEQLYNIIEKLIMKCPPAKICELLSYSDEYISARMTFFKDKNNDVFSCSTMEHIILCNELRVLQFIMQNFNYRSFSSQLAWMLNVAALRAADPEMVRLLLRYGANPRHIFANDCPLHLLEQVRWVVNEEERSPWDGLTPIHVCSDSLRTELRNQRQQKIIQLLEPIFKLFDIIKTNNVKEAAEILLHEDVHSFFLAHYSSILTLAAGYSMGEMYSFLLDWYSKQQNAKIDVRQVFCDFKTLENGSLFIAATIPVEIAIAIERNKRQSSSAVSNNVAPRIVMSQDHQNALQIEMNKIIFYYRVYHKNNHVIPIFKDDNPLKKLPDVLFQKIAEFLFGYNTKTDLHARIVIYNCFQHSWQNKEIFNVAQKRIENMHNIEATPPADGKKEEPDEKFNGANESARLTFSPQARALGSDPSNRTLSQSASTTTISSSSIKSTGAPSNELGATLLRL